MKAIFPFYKGENMSNNVMGYTTEANARRRMNKEKIEEDLIKTLPEDYWLDYSNVYKLSRPWNENIKPGSGYGVNTAYAFFSIPYYTYFGHNVSSKTPLKDLPKDLYDMFIEFEEIEERYIGKCSKEGDKERYKELLFDFLRKGYYPHVYKDDKDYKKRLSKYIKENVEYKTVEVTLELKYYEIEETNKKAENCNMAENK